MVVDKERIRMVDWIIEKNNDSIMKNTHNLNFTKLKDDGIYWDIVN